MKIRLLAILLALLSASTAVPQTSAPCKLFRVPDAVERVIYEGDTKLVAFFDLRFFYGHHMNFDPPSARYYSILRKGNKVIVRGRQCGTEYYVDSVKRVR